MAVHRKKGGGGGGPGAKRGHAGAGKRPLGGAAGAGGGKKPRPQHSHGGGALRQLKQQHERGEFVIVCVLDGLGYTCVTVTRVSFLTLYLHTHHIVRTHR